MAKLQAATRIVEIDGLLAETFLGTPKRSELMAEQRDLWDTHFAGRPYDEIAKDAWQHKTFYRWGLPTGPA